MPERLFGLEETGLSLGPKKKGAFYHRDIKNMQMIFPTEGKTMYTVLFCNAAGNCMPPYIIYRGQPATWMAGAGGPEGISYITTLSKVG